MIRNCFPWGRTTFTNFFTVLCLLVVVACPGITQAQPETANQIIEVNDNGVLDDYKLVAGDIINIGVFGEPDLSVVVQLNDAGSVSYPYLGRIKVVGNTLLEVQKIITAGLKGDYLIDPKVSVTINAFREIYVSGEVVRGGNFSFQPSLTINKAIALAGGFTERAARNRIKVVSEGFPDSKSVIVDLDYVVKPGDVITVPRRFF